MRSILNADRLKKVQIHHALLRSPRVNVLSFVGGVGPPAMSSGLSIIVSDIACLHILCLHAGEEPVVDYGYERTDDRNAYRRDLQINHHDPSQQKPDNQTSGRRDLKQQNCYTDGGQRTTKEAEVCNEPGYLVV